MNNQRISLLVISAIGILATFMPWSSVPILGSMNGINTTIGKFSIIFFIFPLVVCLIGNKSKELKKSSHYIIIISSVIAVMLDSIQLLVLILKPQSENPLDILISEQIRIGFGLYLAILSGIMLPVFLFLMKSKEETKKNIISKPKITHSELIPQKTEKQKKVNTSKDYSNAIDSLKKEKEIKKDFEPSDHSRYMPK